MPREGGASRIPATCDNTGVGDYWVPAFAGTTRSVSGQHRGRYAEVAALLGACVEMLRARGQPQAAEQLVQRVRDRFPRHSAFQIALDTAMPQQNSRR